MSESNGEVVHVPQGGTIKSTEGDLSWSMQESMITSLDLSNNRHARMFVRATSAEIPALADSIDTQINVEHAIAHGVILYDDKTKSHSNAIRLVLIEADGSMLQCVSKGAWDSLRKITLVYGPLPWKGGKPLIARSVKARQVGRRFFFELPSEDCEDGEVVAVDCESTKARRKVPKEK
jgi:hypothetical protein